MAARLVIGLGLTVLTLVLAGRRVWWLYSLIRSGQPASGRTEDLGARLRVQLVEVFGQRRLLRWTVPGLAHFFTFWGFVILITVYIEAYGVLFDENFAIPLVGHSPVLGFLQDFIALAVLASIITFAIMRVRQAPERRQRASRFYGSHTGGAWLILFMIFNVIWTLFLFRGTEVNNGTFPYRSGAFASDGAAALLAPLGAGSNQVLETVGLLLHIGVMLAFLIIVLYSKHLHIFIAPINVAAKRMPKALGRDLAAPGRPAVDPAGRHPDGGLGRPVVVEHAPVPGRLTDLSQPRRVGRLASQDQGPARQHPARTARTGAERGQVTGHRLEIVHPAPGEVARHRDRVGRRVSVQDVQHPARGQGGEQDRVAQVSDRGLEQRVAAAGGAPPDPVRDRAEVVGQAAVSDDHALGRAGRARRVHHVDRVRGQGRHRPARSGSARDPLSSARTAGADSGGSPDATAWLVTTTDGQASSSTYAIRSAG